MGRGAPKPRERRHRSVAGLFAEAVAAHRQGDLATARRLYRTVLQHDSRHADALHLSALVEHAGGNHEAALRALDTAIEARPGIAAFHVSRSAVLLALARTDDAAAASERALALDPANPEALNLLGNVRLTAGDAAAAAARYRQALALRPAYPEALNNLGSALRRDAPEQAEAALRQALALRPGYAAALANLGLVLQEQARYADALDAYEQALAQQPDHAAARGNRAMLLLLLGRLQDGFAEYEWRWRMPGFTSPARGFREPAWDGRPGAGRTLLIHAEQGLGSAIQFVRFAASAASSGLRVVLECQPPLTRLFRQSLTGPGRPVAEVVVKGASLPAFDLQLPLMSLPHRLRTSLESIPANVPYLRASVADRERWQGRLAAMTGPRVGIVWAGNAKHENDANRSLPPSLLAPLLQRSDVRFFSLQVPAAAEIAQLSAPAAIADLALDLDDFATTAAVLESLDLLISVDTAAAHLAGALGRPVWLLLPFVPEWRWLLDRADTPWYPTMRLFRQRAPGDWAELIGRVGHALDALMEGQR